MTRQEIPKDERRESDVVSTKKENKFRAVSIILFWGVDLKTLYDFKRSPNKQGMNRYKIIVHDNYKSITNYIMLNSFRFYLLLLTLVILKIHIYRDRSIRYLCSIDLPC